MMMVNKSSSTSTAADQMTALAILCVVLGFTLIPIYFLLIEYCAKEFRIIIITSSTMPVANNAWLVFAGGIPHFDCPMLVVSVRTGDKIELGKATALPKTMITAIVSPTARPMPRIILASIPDLGRRYQH